jgi:XRE family transcriptional regulator, aerobic/anaerobic benzoate catabolism transcriptional regulator
MPRTPLSTSSVIIANSGINSSTNSSTAFGEDKSPTLLALGEQVRALRARRGQTRKTLAASAQVSERHLANLESGQGNASVLILQQVAQALGCHVADLLGDATTTGPEWLLLRELLHDKNDTQLKQARLALTALFNEAGAASRSQIALVGLRGAGKSTLGAALAAALGYRFVELNSVIELLAGCKVADIHTLYGANAYRRYERRALDDTLNAHPEVVIATPGGLVSDTAALALLLKRCTTVWLQATPEEHMARVLAQGDKRPMKGNREAMLDLRRILKEREAFYAKATHTLHTSQQSVADSVQAILDLIR